MASGLWIGVAAAAGALATAIAGRNAATLGKLFEDDDQEEIDQTGVAAGAPGPAGGGGGGLGPVAGMPGPSSGGGPALGPVVAQGTPMPASPGGPAGGFPGTFPTMGPGSTVFGFGGGRRFHTRFLFGNGIGYWPLGYPYVYPPAPNPEYVCQWEETPPKDDTKMICVPEPGRYPVMNAPVAWGPPGWAWW